MIHNGPPIVTPFGRGLGGGEGAIAGEGMKFSWRIER